MPTLDKLMMFHLAVSKMEEVKAFYTEKLGFTVTKDFTYDEAQAATPSGPPTLRGSVGKGQAGVAAGSRWISMTLPGGGTSINLTNVFENMKPGGMKLYLSTPDIEAAHQELRAKGVQAEEILRAGWGTSFGFTDPDGNQWRVVEAKQ